MYLNSRKAALEAMENLKTDLEKVIQVLKKGLVDVPEGRIRIQHRARALYYQWILPGKPAVTLNKKECSEVISQLINKQYSQKALRHAEKELADVEKFLEYFPDLSVSEEYTQSSEDRKRSIKPVIKPVELLVEEWLDIPYTPNMAYEKNKIHATNKGDLVRSKSEVFIANELFSTGIPYKYECPLYLKNRETIHPDFTIFDRKTCQLIYWEHLGAVDKVDYALSSFQRLIQYRNNRIYLGKNLIITIESENYPLTLDIVKDTIKEYLE